MAIVLSNVVPPHLRDHIELFKQRIPPPSGPILIRGDTREAETLCRHAGLKSLAVVLEGVERTGKWPPGIRIACTLGSGEEVNGPSFPFGYDPQLLRAWARIVYPDAVDEAVTSPPLAGWWWW